MPKTIRELADKLNVSKQTIQYHYQRLPAKNRQKDSRGTNMINLTAERIISDKVAKNQQISSKEVPNTSKENNELVATLRGEIEDLKAQRDKQLATKDRQIDHLTKLIDQQQQLQLATVAENKKLSSLLENSNTSKKYKKIIRKRTYIKISPIKVGGIFYASYDIEKFVLLSYYTKKQNKTDKRQIEHAITLLEDWLVRKGE